MASSKSAGQGARSLNLRTIRDTPMIPRWPLKVETLGSNGGIARPRVAGYADTHAFEEVGDH